MASSGRGLPLTRRHALGAIGLGLGLLALGGCDEKQDWHAMDLTGSAPDLAFTMTRASDGKEVTAEDFHGHVVLLYFGYTFCPDVCPTTLLNLSTILGELGEDADKVRVLFVTVDPERDTRDILADYVSNFAPQVVGLRGTADQIAALARRYRVVYSVDPGGDGDPYEVSHSSAIFAFGPSGEARLLISSLGTVQSETDATIADLRRLIGQTVDPGFITRLKQLF